jgi:hypothetical protein
MALVGSSKISIGGCPGQRAGQRDRLALTARQAVTPVSQLQIITIGHAADKIMRARNAGQAQQLVIVDGAVQHDVLAYRSGEQNAFLQGRADLAAQKGMSIWARSAPSIRTMPSAGG